MANGYTFQWNIKYLSYCWLKKGEPIDSPTFKFDTSPPSKWSLVLYPRGIITEDHVGVYLRRESIALGPLIIEASFQFAVLNTHGSIVNEFKGPTRGFAKGSISGIGEFIKQDKIFGAKKEKFFPLDILTIHCTLWIKDSEPVVIKHISAGTTFKLNGRSFYWSIDKFSTLRPGQMNHFVVMNESKKNLVLFNLVSGFKGEINLQLISCDASIKSLSLKISVIDSEGRKVNFANHIHFEDFTKLNMPLISREQLMKNGSEYLQNDAVTLYCDFAFSTGAILHRYDENSFGIIYPKEMKKVIKNKNKPIDLKNEIHQLQALLDDLKYMYSDAILCDIELRTSTKTFPAHKNILSARSSVFRRMFSSDMREKNSGKVDITDLEDDTLHRMLLYVYTDVLEDLQFESASKLYSASDKYGIFSLKEKCSCFLKENMIPTKACELLVLADRHQDHDLKCVLQDYVLCHDKEVFTSREWKDFMVTNLQLASDIMYLKVCSSKD